MFSPLDIGSMRMLSLGGADSLRALEQRISHAQGDVAMEVNQLAHERTIQAMEHAAEGGTRLHLLADARVPDGGMDARIRQASEGSGGSYVTYGSSSEQWQHAKTYHFTTPRGGPEAWIGNLAPIDRTLGRTELSLVLGGDAAAAARAVTDTTLASPGSAGVRDAVAAAGRYGVLFNDPQAGAFTLRDAISDVLHGPVTRDLLVVTKGIEHPDSTSAIIDAHRAGRQVQVFVRDLARADGERLDAAGVDTTILRGGLQPRVNAYFAGRHGVNTSAFLWNDMLGAGSTSRDGGVLLDGEQGLRVREAALASTLQSSEHVPLRDALAASELPEHI
jgi:hypothetical protein